MRGGGRSKRKQAVAAQVFLRSVSGRSVRDLAEGPLPEDLSIYRPPESARVAVRRHLELAGFTVFDDAQELTLSIEGPPAAYQKAFGARAIGIKAPLALRTVRLLAPPEIRDLVEDVMLLPAPEMF